MSKRKTVAEGWVPLRHGIPSSYNRGCRCDECRARRARDQVRGGYSRKNKQARYSERVEIDGRLVHPNPYGGHGSRTAYLSCECRCDPCREAWSAYRRRPRVQRTA